MLVGKKDKPKIKISLWQRIKIAFWYLTKKY